MGVDQRRFTTDIRAASNSQFDNGRVAWFKLFTSASGSLGMANAVSTKVLCPARTLQIP
jgi:hypothetical protein